MSGSNIIVSDYLLEQIHAKGLFDFQKTFADIADNGIVLISMRPQNKDMHLVVTVDVEGKSYFKSYVDTTWTADGTLGETFNRYINNAPSADSLIYYSGAVDALGTQRFDKLIPAGSGPLSTGATSSSRIESILESGHELTLSIQNVSGQVKDIGVTIEWYEE